MSTLRPRPPLSEKPPSGRKFDRKGDSARQTGDLVPRLQGPRDPQENQRDAPHGRPACRAAGPCGPSAPRPRDRVRGALMATSGLTSLTCTLPTIPDQNAILREVKQSVQGSRALSSCWGQAQKGRPTRTARRDPRPLPASPPPARGAAARPPPSPARDDPGTAGQRGDRAVVVPLYLLKSGARW